MRAASPEAGGVGAGLREGGAIFRGREETRDFDLLGGEDVDGEEVGVGVMGLGVGAGDFVEDGVVREAKVAAEEVDQDAWG